MSQIYKIKIYLIIESNYKIDFDYIYNKNTTFQDLLEYIAATFSFLNICSCYIFSYYNNSQIMGKYDKDDIDINNRIYSLFYYKKKADLFLYKRNEYCSCDELIKDYLKKSKKTLISDFIFQNEKLKRKITDKENEIKLLIDEKKEDLNQIHSLKNEKEAQKYKIENLNKEKKKKEEDLNKLNKKIKDIESTNESKINDLKKQRQILEMAIDGDFDKIDKIKDFGIYVSNLKPKDDIIKIGENNQIIGEKKGLFNRNQFINFYDVIVNIKSIKDINKGWEIILNKDNYNKYKDEKTIKIGVIGNSNKGKSFLLSKISKITLPSGTSIRTEGLSIKYPELNESFKDRRIVLLDSAGLETPVLKDESDNRANKIDTEKKKKEIKEMEGEEFQAETKMINGQQFESKVKSIPIEDKKEDIVKIFQERFREKLITELFLQNYIIFNSNILIIVIGILTYSEQKLLNRIRNEIYRNGINKPLFIIHNLITYTTQEQVEEYVENFLLKSVTFNLEEGHKISTKTSTKNGKYFYEKNTNPKVFHLLFANEGSAAGKIYNEFTLQFLENTYQNVTDLKPFDVVETIKDRFEKISRDIIEQTEKIEFDDSQQEIIKLNSPKDLTLKKCLIDELGFSNLKSNGFEPAYIYYKKDNKIIAKIEAPGNCQLKSELVFSGEYSIIKISGEKRKDKDPEKLNDNIINKRETGIFSLNIALKQKIIY